MTVLISAFVAAVAVFISYLQWRTAKLKLLVDMLPIRIEIYHDLKSFSVGFVPGCKSKIEKQFLDAIKRVKFYFGPELETYLLMSWMLMGKLEKCHPNPNESTFDESTRLGMEYHRQIEILVQPYMQVEARLPISFRKQVKTIPAVLWHWIQVWLSYYFLAENRLLDSFRRWASNNFFALRRRIRFLRLKLRHRCKTRKGEV